MIGKALQNLRPGSKWTVRGGTYSGIEWKDTEQTKRVSPGSLSH